MARSFSTRSQIFSIDMIIAAVIFTTALIFFYRYSLDMAESQENTLENLVVGANSLSNFIVSQGYPKGWNESDVILIGICDNYEINESKITAFSGMDYETTKTLLSSHYDYYIFFEDMNGELVNIYNISGIGKPGVNATNINATEAPEDIIKLYRYSTYSSDIIRIGMYVW